jgi:hypothetical protein
LRFSTLEVAARNSAAVRAFPLESGAPDRFFEARRPEAFESVARALVLRLRRRAEAPHDTS